MKLMAEGFEFTAQLLEVINFAIVGDNHIASLVGHRLSTSQRQVQDRQPSMPESERAVYIQPLAIRTTVHQAIRHHLDDTRRYWSPVQIIHPSNATHASASRSSTVLAFALF